MLAVSFSLEFSEIVLNKHRNPEEIKEGIPSASLKGASSFAVLMESIRPCSKSLSPPKRSNPHSLAQVESGLMWTPYPGNHNKYVIKQ